MGKREKLPPWGICGEAMASVRGAQDAWSRTGFRRWLLFVVLAMCFEDCSRRCLSKAKGSRAVDAGWGGIEGLESCVLPAHGSFARFPMSKLGGFQGRSSEGRRANDGRNYGTNMSRRFTKQKKERRDGTGR